MSELTTGGINFGYESPVNIIMGQVEQEIKQIQNETENTIMSEIRQQLGVYVDKEELVKALQYDRNQYDKGYSDGRASMAEELKIAEEKVINNLNSLKGNWGCDYHKNGVISDCISAVHNSFEELKGENNE